jgi:hypothetical protein
MDMVGMKVAVALERVKGPLVGVWDRMIIVVTVLRVAEAVGVVPVSVGSRGRSVGI